MTAQIKSWTHPTTGQVRLYINHGGEAKVWMTEAMNGGWDVDFKRAPNFEPEHQFNVSLLGRGYSTALDYAFATAEYAIRQYFRDRRPSQVTFADLVTVAGTEPPPYTPPARDDSAGPADTDGLPWDVDEPVEESPAATDQAPTAAYLDRLASKAEDERVAAAITADDLAAYTEASDRPAGPAKRRHRRKVTADVATRTGSDTLRVGRLLVDRYNREQYARRFGRSDGGGK